MSHNFVIGGKVYIKMDTSGRFSIPPQMYPCAADTRLRYDVSVAEDGVIVVTFRRHLPYAKGKQRIYISPKIREQYGYDPSIVFECTANETGFILKRAKLGEVLV